MRTSNRIFMYGPFGLVALLAAAVGLYWQVSASALSSRLDAANGGEIVPGVTLTFAGKSIGGFPFRFDLLLEDVIFTHRGSSGETVWRAERLAVHRLSYGRDRYVLEADGLQSISLPGDDGPTPRIIHVTPALARASAILASERLVRFDLDLWQVTIRDASIGAVPDRSLAAQRAQLHLLEGASGAVHVALKLDRAQLGRGYQFPLGREITLLSLQAQLTEASALDGLRGGEEGFFPALERWRQRNGILAIDSMALDWGGLQLETRGGIALDSHHRLAGEVSGTLDAADYLSALTGRGVTANLGAISTRLVFVFRDGDVFVEMRSGLDGSSR